MLCYRCGGHVKDGISNCSNCASPPGAGNGGRRQRLNAESVPYKPGELVASRYQVSELVGSGPLGWRYRVVDTDVNETVGLKILSPRFLQLPEEKAAFFTEVGRARRLDHPNVGRVFDVGLDGDRPYVVQQNLEGLTLRRLIELRRQKSQGFTLKEVEPIVAQIAAALDSAGGNAHGDLKPDNVVVLPDLLKLTDFALATSLPRAPFMAAQRAAGVHRYLAPEFLLGERLDARTDVYALGMMLGELLSGTNQLDLLATDPLLPRAVTALVRRATAADPKDRFATALEMSAELSELVRPEPAAGSRPRPPETRPNGTLPEREDDVIIEEVHTDPRLRIARALGAAPPTPPTPPTPPAAVVPAPALGRPPAFAPAPFIPLAASPEVARIAASVGATPELLTAETAVRAAPSSRPASTAGDTDSAADEPALNGRGRQGRGKRGKKEHEPRGRRQRDPAWTANSATGTQSSAATATGSETPAFEALPAATREELATGVLPSEPALHFRPPAPAAAQEPAPELAASDATTLPPPPRSRPPRATSLHFGAQASEEKKAPVQLIAVAVIAALLLLAFAISHFTSHSQDAAALPPSAATDKPAADSAAPKPGAARAAEPVPTVPAEKPGATGTKAAAPAKASAPAAAAPAATKDGAPAKAARERAAEARAARETERHRQEDEAVADAALKRTEAETARAEAQAAKDRAAAEDLAALRANNQKTQAERAARQPRPAVRLASAASSAALAGAGAPAAGGPGKGTAVAVATLAARPVEAQSAGAIPLDDGDSLVVSRNPESRKRAAAELAAAAGVGAGAGGDMNRGSRAVLASATLASGAAAAAEVHCPAGMRLVPAGASVLGSDPSDDLRNFGDRAAATVTLRPYCMDAYEWPNQPGKLPRMGAAFGEADAGCRSEGKRLCSEDEWEKACKGPRNLRFPYGQDFDADACNTQDKTDSPRAVAGTGSFNRCKSGYGVYDLSGNVAEWTASAFEQGAAEKVVKGGSAARPSFDDRCASRRKLATGQHDIKVGFRCCAEAR